MASQPTVTILKADGTGSGSTHPLPQVFLSPVRPDVVQYVLTELSISVGEQLADCFADRFIRGWQRTSVSHML